MAKTILQKKLIENQEKNFKDEVKRMDLERRYSSIYFYHIKNKCFRENIDTIIRDNASYKDGSYGVSVSELDQAEKKIMLSYLLDLDDYEDTIKHPTRVRIMLENHEELMDYILYERANDLYQEIMSDMNMKLCHHNDNGEAYYRLK